MVKEYLVLVRDHRGYYRFSGKKLMSFGHPGRLSHCLFLLSVSSVASVLLQFPPGEVSVPMSSSGSPPHSSLAVGAVGLGSGVFSCHRRLVRERQGIGLGLPGMGGVSL